MTFSIFPIFSSVLFILYLSSRWSFSRLSTLAVRVPNWVLYYPAYYHFLLRYRGIASTTSTHASNLGKTDGRLAEQQILHR